LQALQDAADALKPLAAFPLERVEREGPIYGFDHWTLHTMHVIAAREAHARLEALLVEQAPQSIEDWLAEEEPDGEAASLRLLDEFEKRCGASNPEALLDPLQALPMQALALRARQHWNLRMSGEDKAEHTRQREAFETHIVSLARRIVLRKELPEDMRLLADYVCESADPPDPIAMGWVGSNGLPCLVAFLTALAVLLAQGGAA
jgi:hypothetical protein